MKKTKEITKWEIMINELHRKHDLLLKNIKGKLPEMEKLLFAIMRSEGIYEGKLYRFYHDSFKVYYLQETTAEIVKLLEEINPNDPKKFCDLFEGIIRDGKIGDWKHEHNKEWAKYTRPIVEAFLHAKYFLEMAIICGKELKRNKKAPIGCITQRWAALLELYKIR